MSKLRLNIRGKVVLYTMSVVAMTVAAMAVFFAFEQRKVLETLLSEQLITASDILSRTINKDLAEKNIDDLNTALLSLKRSRKLDKAIISDETGKIIVDGTRKNKKKGHTLSSPYIQDLTNYDGWDVFDNDKEIVIVGAQFNGDDRIGVIYLSYPKKNIKKKLLKIYEKIFYIFLSFMGFGFIFALVFSGRIVGPLKILAEKAPLIRQGGTIPLSVIARNDEIGTLSRTLALLIKDLKSTNDELKDAADTLELKVRERTKELETATFEAQKADQAKSAFLTTMSHEIRTPLTAIIGFSDILLQKDIPDEDRKQIAHVYNAAKSLLIIINDILDLSQLDNNKMEIEKEPFNLKELLEATKKYFVADAEQKPIKFISIIPDNLPEKIIGDTTRVKQILINLLKNAFKFTDQGQVTFKTSVLSLEANKVTVEFSVEDTGIGIPLEAQEQLFAHFFQADSSISRKYGGSGLGLSICKRLSDIMGGELNVSSEPGNGSRFWFTMTFDIAKVYASKKPKEAETKVTPLTDEEKKNIKILVAEDNLVNQKLIEALLTKQGLKFDLAENGLEALKMAEKKKYTLLLMDIQMPEMDGLEATGKIRQLSDYYLKAPIIAITAHAVKGDVKHFKDAGMTEVLNKPINAKELITVLTTYGRHDQS